MHRDHPENRVILFPPRLDRRRCSYEAIHRQVVKALSDMVIELLVIRKMAELITPLIC